MKEKLECLAEEKNMYLKKVSSQDNMLSGIRSEAQAAVENSRRLERKTKEAENHIADMEDHIADLNKKEQRAEHSNQRYRRGEESDSAKVKAGCRGTYAPTISQ
jgi:septal ring factor EnvC (AmiA/AmiB activator)